ncbi:uncharacterized protein [Drosophila tropicalis]|uniref:uncharacterized protein n=1 Tax=Drosophila tropicalis TaxID=46794 RepID=UPI0035AB75BA
MRPYYEDPCGCPPRHHHGRPNVEIDILPSWGGSYYPPPPPRSEVVVVTPAATYMPGQQMVYQQPQPYGQMSGMSMASAGYYQQQQGYQYQYQ